MDANQQVTFTSNEPATLADFNNDIVRLSNIDSLDCSFLVASQVDRVGRPFVGGMMIPADMQNEYNSNSDPDTWDAAYNGTILASLQAVALADGDPAWNGFYTAQVWADIFADDRLLIDIKKAQSVDYLRPETSMLVPQDWNDSDGRALDYDVHETTFNILITSFDPFIDDFVEGNDVPFLADFPFLAPPH